MIMPTNAPSRKMSFWIRVGVMILALVGVFYTMGYFRSGEFTQSEEVQEFLNPTEAERKARVVVDDPPAPGSTPAESANDR